MNITQSDSAQNFNLTDQNELKPEEKTYEISYEIHVIDEAANDELPWEVVCGGMQQEIEELTGNRLSEAPAKANSIDSWFIVIEVGPFTTEEDIKSDNIEEIEGVLVKFHLEVEFRDWISAEWQKRCHYDHFAGDCEKICQSRPQRNIETAVVSTIEGQRSLGENWTVYMFLAR